MQRPAQRKTGLLTGATNYATSCHSVGENCIILLNYLRNGTLLRWELGHFENSRDYRTLPICETARGMAQTLAPEVRAQFAQRLKTLRTQRGFDRARYFAKSLGIEENRYTRYERAEVEPSLTLIHKMCETLRVSPNELLGLPDVRYHGNAALSLESAPEAARGQGEMGGRGTDPLSSLAWSLAAEAVAIRQGRSVKSKPAGDPLAALRETSALFSSLQAEPFGTVAAILGEAALKDIGAEHKTRLAELIQAYTEGISHAALARAR
jgi:transcriptional regulator with XRE-family HTH domain